MTLWTIAANDLKITIKDKMFFFWLLAFPLLFTVVFSLAFPESSPEERRVALSVLDKDKGFLSQALVEELSSKKYAVRVVKNESDMGTRTLIIPENFTQDILAGRKAELILEKEPGSYMEASQAAYSHVLKAIIKIITKIVSVVPQDLRDLEARYDKLNIKQLISLKAERAGKIRTIPSGFNHTVPAISVMFILFTVLMYGGINLLQERREGQLERIYMTPTTFTTIISGKWLSRLCLGMLQIGILFLVGKILFKIYLGPSLLGLFFVAFFFCGTIAGMSIFLGSIIRKEEILVVFNILLANIMASLGGCWWPIEVVPKGIRSLSFLFPTGWAMDAFHKLIYFGQDMAAIGLNILILFFFTLVFLVLAVKFFVLRRT